MRRTAGVIAAIVGVALIALLTLYVTRSEAPAPSAPPSVTPILSPTPTTATALPAATATPTLTATPATASPAARGEITGALAYPSDFIPPLTVYAISVADPRTFFSVATPRYPLASNTPPRPTYTIAGIAPGTYYVLAYREDNAPLSEERPGVYSQYVVCGSGQSCTDHSLVPVMVRAAEIVSKIDVTDWYYPPEQRYPPRPR